ncbi:MAG: hypothetical protein U1E51_35660 [Candidatus Binatia bacterium]|nr:hypothetical protein [Candidatus Binatia bacterium]
MSTSNSCDHSSSAGGHDQLPLSTSRSRTSLEKERAQVARRRAKLEGQLKEATRTLDKVSNAKFNKLCADFDQVKARLEEITQQLQQLDVKERETRR